MKSTSSHTISRIFNAEPQVVFNLVTDFDNSGSWNTLTPSAKGTLKVGNEIKMILNLNGKKRPFNPKVISLNLNRSFTLSKIIFSKKLGELNHKFEFHPLENGKTELRQTWIGRGIIIKLLWPLIKRGFSEFEILNEDLARHLEKQIEI